jgi:hypothetical protein
MFFDVLKHPFQLWKLPGKSGTETEQMRQETGNKTRHKPDILFPCVVEIAGVLSFGPGQYPAFKPCRANFLLSSFF